MQCFGNSIKRNMFQLKDIKVLKMEKPVMFLEGKKLNIKKLTVLSKLIQSNPSQNPQRAFIRLDYLTLIALEKSRAVNFKMEEKRGWG